MSLTIWKTTIPPFVSHIKVPRGAELLIAREQFGHVCVWYRCDPQAPLQDREIKVVMTGGDAMGDGWRYLGMAALQEGAIIVHVFEPTQ